MNQMIASAVAAWERRLEQDRREPSAVPAQAPEPEASHPTAAAPAWSWTAGCTLLTCQRGGPSLGSPGRSPK